MLGTSGYEQVTGLADVFARAGQLAVTTMIFDIEPLVAPWNSGQQALDSGIAEVLSQVRTVPSVRAVVFSTNSARRPSAVPAGRGLQVRYLASAGKPLRTAPYRDLPRPGAVIGDQLPTDGVLAYRLGYTFLHYAPADGRRADRAPVHAPMGPARPSGPVPTAGTIGPLRPWRRRFSRPGPGAALVAGAGQQRIALSLRRMGPDGGHPDV